MYNHVVLIFDTEVLRSTSAPHGNTHCPGLTPVAFPPGPRSNDHDVSVLWYFLAYLSLSARPLASFSLHCTAGVESELL